MLWTDTPEGRKLVETLSRTVVAEVGPDEMPTFEQLMADYFQDPHPPKANADEQDDPLGFGLGAMALLTPAAAAMVVATIKYLGSEAFTVARNETAELVKAKIARLFHSDDDDQHGKKPAALAREQLERIRRLARKEAEAFGIAPATAEQMAKALVGALVLAK